MKPKNVRLDVVLTCPGMPDAYTRVSNLWTLETAAMFARQLISESAPKGSQVYVIMPRNKMLLRGYVLSDNGVRKLF